MAYPNSFIVGSQAAMLALVDARLNDICFRTDLQDTFILSALPPSNLPSWAQIAPAVGFSPTAGPGIGISGSVISSLNVLPSGVDVGSGGNAYVVNPTPAVAAVFGASFTFTTTNASTGPATLNASGTGVKNLRTMQNTAFAGTEINNGGTQVYQVVYDGTEWLLAGTLTAGVPANPAGILNLAGAYLIPTPSTQNGSSAGLSLLSTPGNSSNFDRNLLNFIWVQSGGGQNLQASFGYDGDDVFILTGTPNFFAIEIPVEIFRPIYIYDQSTGDSITVQQNNTPAAGAAALVVLQPFLVGNGRMFVLSAANGLITTYNSIPTVSNGVPAEYATADEVAQTAAISATPLYTPAATGMFRISVYAKVTTADGVSSTLGGASGLTIGYDDGTDGTAQTTVALLATQAGAAAIVNAGNSLATKLIGSVEIFAEVGVPITYAFGYTSNTPGAMNYELHLKLEAL